MNVKEYLEFKKMSVREFAEKFRISKMTAYRYKDGLQCPTLKKAKEMQEISEGLLKVESLRSYDG